MPYRRLPNTDNARIRALKTAIEKNRMPLDRIVSSDVINMTSVLHRFESAQMQYRDSLKTQAKENQKLQKLVKNARLYISHFIQVLNFAVIRGELKKECKQYYHLDIDDSTVPDLTSNEALLVWGENLIMGEQNRVSYGGVPIYNPSMARVNVAFSQFKSAHQSQKIHQSTTARQLETMSVQRADIDQILTTAWNEIEAAFAHLPAKQRCDKCKEYGVVYYLRKGEKNENGEEKETEKEKEETAKIENRENDN